MTKVLTLPRLRRSALSCVWIQTGNPTQPLARVWIDRELRITHQAARNPEPAQPCCA